MIVNPEIIHPQTNSFSKNAHKKNKAPNRTNTLLTKYLSCLEPCLCVHFCECNKMASKFLILFLIKHFKFLKFKNKQFKMV